MDMLTNTLQCNILAVFKATPREFYEKYESVIMDCEKMPMDSLILVLNNLSERLIAAEIPINIGALPKLMADGEVDKVELMAEALALSTLIYMQNCSINKPFSWWKDWTMRLVDFSTPLSQTIH